VGARQFAGAQESPLHKRLKFLIAELLSDDPNAQNDVEIDTRLDGKIGYRKPDVRVTYADRPMAFEIQLSSTQLPTIIARENFYTSEGRSLIWIAWNPDLGIKSDTPQAFLDILTRSESNSSFG
jgi:competence CoiA-like predicted nuclease